MNTALLITLLIALIVIKNAILSGYKVNKLTSIREMLHKERMKALESNGQDIDVNYELEVIEEMLGKSRWSSATFLKIWNHVVTMLSSVFVVFGIMGMVLLATGFDLGGKADNWNFWLAPIMLGLGFFGANKLAVKLNSK